MRIAFLSTFYPLRGGIAQFNAALYRALEKTHEVQAFTFTRQYPGLFFPGTTQYVTADDQADPVPAQPVLDSINPLSYFKTAALIRVCRPDLLLTKFWMPFFAPSLGTVAQYVRRQGAKAIAILDNLLPHERRPGDLQLIRYFLNRCDGFVVMSKVVEQELLHLKPGARYLLKAHPHYDHFGPPLASDQARARLGLPATQPVILFFGFIRDYKGLDQLIRATALLPDDYCVVIAGEMYGAFDRYQRLIDASGAAGKIRLFVRYIADAEVPLFFSAANVCVLPYKSATQSGIVQIAFHFNLPVIVTDVGGLAEMVQDNETGLILRAHDPQALAQKIRAYFEGNMQLRMAQAIAQRRHQNSWEGFAQALVEFYEKLPERAN
ncbi:MAG: glycosyltransferase [candidate division KSB1 bacterium]|nr:glycosyltransferase [candidate division KSB1 bacterium]MDZ7275057.1 glycosyltransferase [candidate division KSB1 bacterium]MDZ7286495.1 glycosyltransferase [candidate division KSB1 bacterium]MDZ7299341.1 glycosyltransferase [candidate division KSB1 bacterium]MDZ7306331.1 glycosyltransferase [candidate division KSB1 bacterium]